jgi:hypothetical protein
MVRRQSAVNDQSDFRSLGLLAARSQLRGKPLGNIDGLLAATAFEHKLTVVTHNTRHFEDLGFQVFDPWESWFAGGAQASDPPRCRLNPSFGRVRWRHAMFAPWRGLDTDRRDQGHDCASDSRGTRPGFKRLSKRRPLRQLVGIVATTKHRRRR